MATARASGVKSPATRPGMPTKKAADLRLKQAQQAAALLKQVSDPARLRVILMLTEGERHVGSISEELAMSQPAVSHHLALLRHGRIIVPRRQGKNNFYTLTETGERLAEVVKALIG
jgi:ArsR family transcriptional regulator, zinc-responsive transcriptional repressor